MIPNSKTMFITHFNESVPNWKKITSKDLSNKSLSKVIDSISRFIDENGLDPKRLVCAVIKFHYEKNKRYPNIFLYKGGQALSLYKNYELPHGIEVTATQEIVISVKKSKILLQNLELNGIVYSKGVALLQQTGKADYYFLLAHGITEGIPDDIIIKWNGSDKLKNLVADTILA